MTTDAYDLLEKGQYTALRESIPLENEVFTLHLGNQDFSFDDQLVLRFDGEISGETGIRSHSRGYAAKTDGVLFTRHGSQAPHYSSTNTPSETDQLRQTTPDRALDIAAEIYHLNLDQWNTFASIAHSPNYYDPSENTPYWAGICQGWTHNALDDRLNVLVDVEGPIGERGLWIFGQWISRADLGNALMGASYSLGIADSITIDSFVTPDSLVKALAEHVLHKGTGLRVDIWNDHHNSTETYSAQVWNQPIVEASIEVSSLPTQTIQDIIRYAENNVSSWGAPQAYHNVRLVKATAQWGAEANDEWEEAPLFKESTWNMYLLTDFQGTVLKGYMAYDLVNGGVQNLPVTESDGLPDYIALPKHQLTDAVMEDGEHFLLNDHNMESKRFQFLVGTVLARGIPNPTRQAFEEAFFAQESPNTLRQQFPGIANAYSPEQWHTIFEPHLGYGERFGAVW